MNVQEKIADWKIEEIVINTGPPTSNNLITMATDNIDQICDVFNQKSSKLNDRTDPKTGCYFSINLNAP